MLVLAGAARASAQEIGHDIHWVRDSAEHEAIFLEVYHAAAARVDHLAADLAGGTWAVILDADETILDNSLYYRRRALAGHPEYDEKSFIEWGRSTSSTALPGSAEFIAHVQNLGGRVVVVTNRVAALCDATRRNLAKLRMDVDAVLCKADADDKSPRYDAVQNGTTGTDLPPLNVLIWIGDNIQDFPHLTQGVRTKGASALADFGTRFFLLPNPMYGSWEANPGR